MAIKVQKKSSRYITLKTLNAQNEERILKAAREKGQVTHKGRPIRITPDFLSETLKLRRAWSEVMQTLEHKCQPSLASKTLNQHRWRKQNIPGQNSIYLPIQLYRGS